MSILDTLKNSKGLSNETGIKQAVTETSFILKNRRPTEPVKTVQQCINTNAKPKPFKLGIGVAKTKPVSTDEEQPTTIHDEVSSNSPLKELASVMQTNSILSDNSISSILGDISNEIAETSPPDDAEASAQTSSIQQNNSRSATIEDLSKFVFTEQPDESTEEIALKFSGMFDGLLDKSK